MTGQGGRRVQVQAWVVVVGVALVAVPSMFDIFPETTQWRLPVRVAISAAWVAAAVGTVVLAGRREAKVEQVVATAARQREQLRVRATDDILSALLGERMTGLPDTYRFTVYVHDPESECLLPVFPEPSSDPQDVRAFSIGCGATGYAFEKKTLVLVTGDAVSDETYGLTPPQQQRWSDYRAVVATPIWVDGERPIGVLSGISKDDEASFDHPGAQARLREVADVIGVVLVSVSHGGVD